jgi:glycosyltransferase involved in cell wall biosynthesis
MTRVAVICDLLEDRWFSMDLLADMLLENFDGASGVELERVRHELPPSLARLALKRGATARERWSKRIGLGLGRYAAYPLALYGQSRRFDWFHVVDHSYAHLALELPAGRCGVYCHDVDAFRALFDTPRASLPHRALARILLSGMRRARVVFHSTEAVRDEIIEHRLVPEERLVHVPYGVAAEFTPEPNELDEPLRGRPPFLLHVGSLIPRKNPEFLLRVIAEVCDSVPELEIVQVGGRWTREQQSFLEERGIAARVRQFERLGRAALAPYYRSAKAVLLPSTAEGFGLPVVEALACGTPVVASDIPVLAQVGGDAIHLCPIDDLRVWKTAVLDVVAGRGARREACLRIAAKYTWKEHANTIVRTYSALASEK